MIQTTEQILPHTASAAEGQRAMMRGFPTGVAVLATIDGSGTPRGMTISSVCSISLDPPTLMVCLRSGSPTLEAVLDTGLFSVNLLHGEARPVAELFASGAPDRFDRVRWEHDASDPHAAGPHLFHDAHAVADCRVTAQQQVGDHIAVFGRTLRVTEFPGHPPLVYGLREYRSW
ncbi:flavin reductase family protein [Streptomyces sp. ET3-23]|uniref:flavin reductase family protein n=1 Tax=Streptomyces sp. ET3-23 TaxID=2885643 RepID=UPI001D1140FA|nr:flavin reductase family protein [Streptomyces sp. ET3-23]MCC2274654.1 flavin reductase family protein [Streptomyces sp. ET3-23]